MGSFLEPVVPDITETIPTHISARTSSPIYVAKGVLADVSIAELPFRFSINDTTTYTRATADFRRQQIDTSSEPGEQTLAQWWVRDQNSWHRGAGINFYEPGSNNGATEFRYDRSIGVDVWTDGQATLLGKMTVLLDGTSSQASFAVGARINGNTDVIFGNLGGQVYRHDGTTQTNYSGVTGASEPVIAGSLVLVGTATGIASGSTTGSSLTALWTGAASSMHPWWVKSRIIASAGPKLYDLTLAGGALSDSFLLYNHPDPNWTWTGVAEAPGAIVASGYSNGYGYIYRFALTDPGAGLSPTVGGASQIADFPPGEEVYAIKSYLSTYLAIGTAKGVRIGLLDTDASLQYGPLVVETTKPVRCFGARDTFIFAGIEADMDGRSGCARIDLGTPTDDSNLRYAWAYDAMLPGNGQVTSVAFMGLTDRTVLCAFGKGIYLQSSNLFEATGYIRSGRIRYGTAEPKAFNRAKVRALIPGDSTIGLTTIDQQGVLESIISLGGNWNTDEDITLKSIADNPQGYAQVLLTLNATANGLSTPILEDIQLKATPLPRIQRTIVYPLMIEDIEQDRNGNKVGKVDSAAGRLFALEDLEQGRSVIIIQDFTSGESYSGIIQDIQFVRNTPPSRNRKNFGGVAQVTVLKL